MLAYSILDNSEETGSAEGESMMKKKHLMAYLIENMVKQYKSHRSAADFDAGFTNRIVGKMREEQYGNREVSGSVIANIDNG
jgi:hypothetical protein